MVQETHTSFEDAFWSPRKHAVLSEDHKSVVLDETCEKLRAPLLLDINEHHGLGTWDDFFP